VGTTTLIAGLAIALLVPIAAARADGSDVLRVVGQCRDGRPQGNYALRDADGRLRVQGAFSHGQRVGSFIFWSPQGGRIAHLPFDADRLNGTLSLWHVGAAADDDAARRVEAGYRAGLRHGSTRAWWPNGRLREAAEYADGALASVQAWSEEGAVVTDVQARADADAARAAEERDIDALLATVRRHLPDCSPPSTRHQAARPAAEPIALAGRVRRHPNGAPA
jgi:hypothetical protein